MPYCVFIGGCSSNKDVKLVLDAFSALRRRMSACAALLMCSLISSYVLGFDLFFLNIVALQFAFYMITVYTHLYMPVVIIIRF